MSHSPQNSSHQPPLSVPSSTPNTSPNNLEIPANEASPSPLSTSRAPSNPQKPKQSLGILVLLSLVVLMLIGFLILLLPKIKEPQQATSKSSSSLDHSDLAQLKATNQQIQAQLIQERQRLGLGQQDTNNLTELATRITQDTANLIQAVKELEASTTQKDQSVANTASALRASQQLNANLSVQLQTVQHKLQSLQNNQQNTPLLQNKIETLTEQLQAAQTKLIDLEARPTQDQLKEAKSTLQEEMSKAISLVEENSQLKQSNQQLQEQLQEQLKSHNPATLELLQSELASLRTQNTQLKLEIQKLKAQLNGAKLFIESAENLLPKGAKLYGELKKLEGLSLSNLASEYQRIAQQYDAQVIHHIQFKEGDSHITLQDVDLLQERIQAAQPDALFLVVGYASSLGDAQSNETLSAQRATRSASVIDSLKSPTQKVQAVYLGQTDRFSSEKLSENQICEIWKIR